MCITGWKGKEFRHSKKQLKATCVNDSGPMTFRGDRTLTVCDQRGQAYELFLFGLYPSERDVNKHVEGTKGWEWLAKEDNNTWHPVTEPTC